MASVPQVVRLNSVFEYCCILPPFRIFYNLDEGARSPARLVFSQQESLPDYIADLMSRFHEAYSLFTQQLMLESPLKSDQGFIGPAHHFDILIDDIPVQRGLVSATPADHSGYFQSVDTTASAEFTGTSIKIVLHRDLIAGTATPVHELFHAFQYHYCPLNNMWFMEGLARWAQNLTHTRDDQLELLPQTPQQLMALFERQHDAEYFWRRLFQFTAQPEVLVRRLLEVCRELVRSSSSQDLLWSREQKRSYSNNRLILQALLNVLSEQHSHTNAELDGFCQLIGDYIIESRQHEGNLEIQTPEQLIAATQFEVITGDLTISIPGLTRLEGWDRLQRVGGTLSIRECDALRILTGFPALHQVQNLLIEQNPELVSLDAFPRLFRGAGALPGFLKVINNRKLTDIRFLSGLRTTGSSLYLHHNALTSLEGLESLREVGASLSLSSNAVQNLDPLRGLVRVKGMLGLAFNRLESLAGLEQLQQVSVARWNQEYRSLALQGNPKLQDVSALAELRSDTGTLMINADLRTGVRYPRRAESPFYQQRIRLMSGGQMQDAQALMPLYQPSGKKKVLFDSAGWQAALSALTDIEAFFYPFKDVKGVVNYARQQDIDVVYGQLAKSQLFLSRHADALRDAGLHFQATDRSFVRQCVDKEVFYRFMEACGMGRYIPQVYASAEEAEYPAIVKQTTGGNGRGMEILYSPDDYRNSEVRGVLTEYVKGDAEYATNMIYYRGEVLFEKTYCRNFSSDTFILKAADQSSDVLSMSSVPAPCVETFRDILREFSDELIFCCFDYKMKDNIPKIFEINTRLGYTLARDSASFNDALTLYFRLAEEKGQEIQNEL